MQDIECGHVHECVNGLMEESPGFILRDTFVDSLEVYLVSLANHEIIKETDLSQRLTLNEFLELNNCVNQHEQTNIKPKVGQHEPSGYIASSTLQATSGPQTSPSSSQMG